MSVMTASTSKIHRQPHQVPLPTSPERARPFKKFGKKRKLGKGKEPEPSVPSSSRRIPDASEGEWDHSKAGTKPWQWLSLTDSSTSNRSPVFTKDGSYFFAIAGSSVKVHSTSTGKVVSTLAVPADDLAADSRSDIITSAVLNPSNAFQLITGSLGGFIRTWDFLEGVILQTISIDDPIHHLCVHPNFLDRVFVAAAKPAKGKGSKGGEKDINGIVLHVSLKPRTSPTGSNILISSEVAFIGKTRHVVGLSVSPTGSWLVAVAGHKAYVAPTSSLKSGFTKYVSPEALTCLAFHPSEDYFATGDDKGNIRLWYCLNEQIPTNLVGVEKRAQTTTLHWHAHAVASIAFTSNGAYLLSGGEESVLVIWQLHTGKKEFIPRLGSPITSIAIAAVTANEEYLVGLADATFTFISPSTLKVSRSCSRIKLNPANSYSGHTVSTHAPLAIHSATSTIVIPSSHPSSLQIYSPSSSTLVGELEISPSNKVSRRDEQPIEPACVEIAVISASGEWMATIDNREGDDAFRGEIYLKLWRWDSANGTWVLNTRIDRPHGLERITCATFSPELKDRQSLLFVTTGNDRHVKTWRIRATVDKSGDIHDSWVPRSSFVYRGEYPSHASWSLDGSLFSISMGPSVNLYDAVSNTLRRILTSPNCQTISSAHFIGKSGRYLVVVGIWDIVLWEVSVQTVRWHSKSQWPIGKVLPHPRDDSFALLHCTSKSPRSGRHTTPITLFHAASSTAYAKFTVPFGLLSSAWYSIAHITPPAATAFSLVGITNDYNVVVFGDDINTSPHESSAAQPIPAISADSRKTLFQDIFGISAFSGPSAQPGSRSSPSQQSSMASSGTDTLSLFDTPAYLMAPVASLYEPLMDSLTKSRSSAPQQNEPLNQADEDVDMMGQSDDGTLTFGSQHTRMVNDDEMNLFIDLFKLVKVSSKPVVANKPLTNGTHHPPTPPTLANGITMLRTSSNRTKGTLAPTTLTSGKKSHKRRRSSDVL